MGMRAWIVVVVAAGACSRQSDGDARPVPAAMPYELVCEATDTREKSVMHCARIDTRDGAITRVDLDKLPRSNGPTRSAPGPAGTYTLVCDSTDTELRSDLRCVRLNRATGEMLLIALPQLPIEPQ